MCIFTFDCNVSIVPSPLLGHMCASLSIHWALVWCAISLIYCLFLNDHQKTRLITTCNQCRLSTATYSQLRTLSQVVCQQGKYVKVSAVNIRKYRFEKWFQNFAVKFLQYIHITPQVDSYNCWIFIDQNTDYSGSVFVRIPHRCL